MYTALNLKISLSDFEDPSDLINLGQKRQTRLKQYSTIELENYIFSDGTIDGTKLSNTWFQTVQSDVFLSHSHADTDLAYAVAGWLEYQFGLNIFLDEALWGSADDLLKKLDKKYCWQPDTNTYNYSKRNITTSHIHTMLSTAILSVMDRAEVILFLNTENSLPAIETLLQETNKYTLSPWIYQELMATKLLRVTDWSEYRRQYSLQHSFQKSNTSDLKIAYETPIDELREIDVDSLTLWQKNYGERKNLPYGGLFSHIPNHPLNYLYDILFEKS